MRRDWRKLRSIWMDQATMARQLTSYRQMPVSDTKTMHIAAAIPNLHSASQTSRCLIWHMPMVHTLTDASATVVASDALWSVHWCLTVHYNTVSCLLYLLTNNVCWRLNSINYSSNMWITGLPVINSPTWRSFHSTYSQRHVGNDNWWPLCGHLHCVSATHRVISCAV